MSDPTADALVELIRDEGVAVLASVTRWLGDLTLAQDCVQDAVEQALTTWPTRGVPDNPRGWLVTVARHRAVDTIRRETLRGGKESSAQELFVEVDSFVDIPPDEIRDDVLRLVFTCCHPALAPDARVALSLRVLCGLTTAEVGAALLVSEATMQRRISRAKAKIRHAGIPYRIPSAVELPARVQSVAATIYLLFNEGYSASSGTGLMRADLLCESIRLARLLRRLLPAEPATTGLLALLLLQDARSLARIDAAGRPVLLADQDRSLWRRTQIEEGLALLGGAFRGVQRQPDRYVVQAAIAACHDIAPSYELTAWAAIVSWYDVLLSLDDSAIVRLNRGVAVAELEGAQAGLTQIDSLTDLDTYAEWHASRAELLVRMGRHPDARVAFERAIELESNETARRHLLGRRATVT